MTSCFQTGTAILLGMIAVLSSSLAGVNSAIAAETKAIVRIDGKPITAEQLHLDFYLSLFSTAPTVSERQKLINDLIDQQLMRQFLESQQIKPDTEALDREAQNVELMLARNGRPVAESMSKLHLTKDSLRDLMWVPVAWQMYLDQGHNRGQLIHDWESRKFEFDGTRVKARQIVIFVKPDASNVAWQEAEGKLTTVRQEIMEGKLTFADAAKRDSQSPSAAEGGQLGEFEYHGRVDNAISRVAFHLMPGEISHPFRTRFGVHLVQTEEILPGQLSLEDALPELKKRLSNQLWADAVSRERQKAQIHLLP